MAYIPHITAFLDCGLKQHVPKDINEECNICAMSWVVEPHDIVYAPCRHYFHRACIKRWIDYGPGEVATCPYCRTQLCVRWSKCHGEVEWIEDSLWDGLHIAYQTIAPDIYVLQTITMMIFRHHEASMARMHWDHIVIEAVDMYCTSRRVARESADEYVAVKSIMIVLAGLWMEGVVGIYELEDAIECLYEHERHLESRIIEQAFAAVRLWGLISRVTETEYTTGDDDGTGEVWDTENIEDHQVQEPWPEEIGEELDRFQEDWHKRASKANVRKEESDDETQRKISWDEETEDSHYGSVDAAIALQALSVAGTNTEDYSRAECRSDENYNEKQHYARAWYGIPDVEDIDLIWLHL